MRQRTTASILSVLFLILFLAAACDAKTYPFYLVRNELNISLVIDRSGSMAGDSMANAKEAAKAVVEALNENDILSIVTFESFASVLVEADYVVDKAAIKAQIDTIETTGGTLVSDGLDLGYGEIEKNLDPGLQNTCLLICDGDVDQGSVTLAQGAYEKGIKTSTIAIGLGADTGNLQLVAAEGHGSGYVVTNLEDLTGVFLEEVEDLLSPIDRIE